MNFKLSMVIAFAALFLFWGGANDCFGQVEEPVVGGYAKADVADKQVIAAANFAVKKRAQTSKTNITLLSVQNAEVQVVAGMNYQICLKVRIKNRGKKAFEQFITVFVYRNLKKAYSLTRWSTENCAGQQFPQ